eukprot:942916-Ditylum_brightwellii.AAC.1
MMMLKMVLVKVLSIVLKMVMMIVVMIVLMVLTSTLHISHKELIVILHREVNKTSMLFAKKMLMLMMMLTM